MHDLRWYNNKYYLWNEVYYINDMWRGAEHNDRRGISISKLEREIGEKNKRQICVFWWKRGEGVRLLLFSSGGGDAERSRNVLLRAESSEPISVRHLATGGCLPADATFHYNTTDWVFKANEITVRKRETGEKTRLRCWFFSLFLLLYTTLMLSDSLRSRCYFLNQCWK